MASTPPNPLEQSDEDFLNSQPPVVDAAADEAAAKAAAEDPDPAAGHDAGDPAVEEDDKNDKDPDAKADGEADGDDTTGSEADVNADADPDTAAAATEADKKADAKKAEGEEAKADDPAKKGTDDKAKAKDGEADKAASDAIGSGFTVPKSFKANGKEIEIKSDEEALKLMQMGANYTRKMQELTPHRKVLMMLQNNGLLDENKLSFLIDLDKKDPEAIKKFMVDAKVDPNEIDLTSDLAYVPGGNVVQDEEVGFRTVMEDLSSDPAGKETISEINTGWDDTSKQALWKQPELMTVFHEQRQSGIYDQIKGEVERQRALGRIPVSMPFLAAYKQVGDEMVAEAVKSSGADGQQQDGATAGPGGVATPKQPVAVATRTAAPKATVANGDKASAASPSRSTPSQAKTAVNPLSMSDDDFLKSMENRV